MLAPSGVNSVFWQEVERTAAIVAALRWTADVASVVVGSGSVVDSAGVALRECVGRCLSEWSFGE
jgi:hypothetical protein